MIGTALACLSAFLLFALMILQLPHEASLIRAMDLEMQLVKSCEQGHEAACQFIEAEDNFKQNVHMETEKMQGTCLYISEHGVAIRTQQGNVTNILEKAAALLG